MGVFHFEDHGQNLVIRPQYSWYQIMLFFGIRSLLLFLIVFFKGIALPTIVIAIVIALPTIAISLVVSLSRYSDSFNYQYKRSHKQLSKSQKKISKEVKSNNLCFSIVGRAITKRGVIEKNTNVIAILE